MQLFSKYFLVFGVLFCTAFAQAEQKEAVSPEQLVRDITASLLVEIEDGKAYFEKDPDRYFAKIEALLMPVTDMDYISKQVMGKRYQKRATPEQRAQFKAVFSDSLVRFYGKALLLYEYKSLEVIGSRASKKEKGRVLVDQMFIGTDNVEVPITYTLDNVKGEWKLRNILVKNFNLGRQFQSTFEKEVAKRKRDLDKLIEDWPQIVAKVEDK